MKKEDNNDINIMTKIHVQMINKYIYIGFIIVVSMCMLLNHCVVILYTAFLS